MKYHFIATLALAGLGALTAQAATLVNNYEEAKPLVGDDGFVVVLYPKDWNKKAETLGKELLKSDAVSQAAGGAILMGLPVPNISTKEVQEERKTQLGPIKIDMGRALSYPAIYLCEASGRNYSVIPANAYRTMGNNDKSIRAAAKLITDRMASLKEQREIMGKVEQAQGKRKTDLLASVMLVPGINRPDKIADLAKKIDPKDESGVVSALTFDWYGLVWECVKGNRDAGFARCEALINNPCLPPEQKQMAYACAIGVLRRMGTPDSLKKLREYAIAMRDLDPTSRWGRSHEGALRLWDVSFSLESGWSPVTLPLKDEPTECAGPWPICEPGTYNITFRYTSGRDAFFATKVELYDGHKKVAEDAHLCTAGHKLDKNTYTLKVTEPVSNPRVLVTTSMRGKRDSAGRISISKED